MGSAQDDEVREYYLNLIAYWCQKAVDDLDLVEQEKKILQYMRMKPQKTEETEPVKRKPFKPFIITKSAEQKKVNHTLPVNEYRRSPVETLLNF